MPSLTEHISRLRQPPKDDSLDFYALTLTADTEGRICIGSHSHWVGFADVGRKVELREASIVNAKNMAKAWCHMGQPPLYISEESDVVYFVLLGGNALVEKAIAEAKFSEAIKPLPCHPGGFAGFVSPGLLEPTALKRTATPKLRMRILKRDNMRCRICGRSPDDHLDLELHVHHIRPWASGGITADVNLITLCNTCHTGLEPHYDPSLFAYTSETKDVPYSADFWHGVENYRKLTFACMQEEDTKQ